MKLVLDTHVLLWFFGNERSHLSAAQLEVIQSANDENPLGISTISLWEISTLQSLGRISLPLPLRDWLDLATAEPLVRRHPITPRVAAEVAALPDSFHRDPGDRIIVSTARVLGATLLTQDQRIIESGLVSTLS